MSTTWALLGPFIILFVAALAIAFIQRRSKDSCLKKLDRNFVLIQNKQKNWITGELQVFPKALIVNYPLPQETPEGHAECSYIFYEETVEEIRMVLSPIPRAGTTGHDQWLQQVQRLRHPALLKTATRKFRNLFNMIRDAFAQSIGMLVGVFKQKTAMGKIAGADQQVAQVGQKLLTVIPNSYEPALELYLSKDVAVETFYDSQFRKYVGILEEYSEKFLLLRDVCFDEPPECGRLSSGDSPNHFTVVFPRKQAVVRHFVKRTKHAGLAPSELTTDFRDRLPDAVKNSLPKIPTDVPQ